MSDSTAVRAEDPQVRSRVSWGAVFAGATIALALYFLLALVGAALGLSVSGHVLPSSLGVGAAVWAILSTAAALFVGGWITSQFTEGENKIEAALHGVILWGVLLGVLLWLMVGGVKSGFNALVGLAQTGGVAQDANGQAWEESARRAGVSPETIDQGRRQAATARERASPATADTQNRQEATEAATRAAWWAILGTLVSMAAAVTGSVVGARPTFRLRAVERLSRGMFLRWHQSAGRS